jgi:SAM-dependent methyltransferase
MAEFDRYANEYEQLLKDPVRDRFAGDSKFFYERKLDLIRRFFRQRGKDTANLSWLDVGCGQGDLLSLGKQHFRSVAGCDLSEEMLRYCEGLETRLQTSPEQLPFPDESFDLLTAVCVYHHVPPPQRLQLTKECTRLLKPGGVFAIIEHNPFNPMTQLIVKRAAVDVDAILLRSGEARKLMRSAGLAVAATDFFLYLPKGLYSKAAGLEHLLRPVPLGGQYTVWAERRS